MKKRTKPTERQVLATAKAMAETLTYGDMGWYPPGKKVGRHEVGYFIMRVFKAAARWHLSRR